MTIATGYILLGTTGVSLIGAAYLQKKNEKVNMWPLYIGMGGGFAYGVYLAFKQIGQLFLLF
jgi:hypothetical protein